MPEVRDHPAQYSKPILEKIAEVLADEARRQGVDRLQVLDSFAGVGGIHRLLAAHDTVGVELEPEWAHAHPRTLVGDATRLPASWTGIFHAWVVSVCYGNRFADTYDGKGSCRACKGAGKVGSPLVECSKCDGSGVDQSKRYTYRIYLGRMPTEGSAATMQWTTHGDAYRKLHHDALAEALRVTAEDGLGILNVSNHVRTIGSKAKGTRREVEQEVVEWYLGELLAFGCRIDAVYPIDTQRMGNGANRDKRAESEKLIVFRTPSPRRLL